MKVYIDPQTNVEYTAFYIRGLYDLFGKCNVRFSNRYFEGLKPNRTLKFVIYNYETPNRFVIDWGDDFSIEEADYEWCHYYGKINFNMEKTHSLYHPKITKLAPSFGIKIWSDFASVYYGMQNFIKIRNYSFNIKKFFSEYYKQSKQLPVSSYKPVEVSSNYIYSVNTLWNSNKWINNDDTVNQYRANFINACKSLVSIDFEGGFVYSQTRNLNPKFKNLLVEEQWIPKKKYIDKIKLSILVFNTPAWALCHGWKLGEYLALGKAIISTPILNELPAPLEHGKHIHIVSGEEKDLKEAIELILNDSNYRQKLEKNAYEFYLSYVSPIQSIKLLINNPIHGKCMLNL